MPRFKEKVPEFLAVKFTGSNIREVLDELGPKFSTSYPEDAKDYTSFVLGVLRERYKEDLQVRQGEWVVYNPDTGWVKVYSEEEFDSRFEAVKKPGRPAKDKK